MAVLDHYIRLLYDFVKERRERINSPGVIDFTPQGHVIRHYAAYLTPDTPQGHAINDFADRAERPSRNTIILKKDSAVELGAPETESVSLVLFSNNPEIVDDGKITIIGKDIPGLSGRSVPFGQVVFAAGSGMSERSLVKLTGAVHTGGEIGGYMIRSMPGRLWARVGKGAVDGGLSFRDVGSHIISRVRNEVPSAESVSILFVTSNTGDVKELGMLVAQVEKITRDLRLDRLREIAGDEFECLTDIDCSSCDDRVICGDIQKVFKVTKGDI